MRVCYKCKRTLSLNYFYKDRTQPMNREYVCKECRKEIRRTYTLNNKDKIKKYALDNKKHIQKWRHKYRNRPEIRKHIRKQNREYYRNNRKKCCLQKQLRIKNKPEIYREIDKRVRNSKKRKVWLKQYRRKNRIKLNSKAVERRKNNLNIRLKEILRSRINKIVSNSVKTSSAVRDLGCSIEFLKQYLESKFQPGMTWENYGKYGWHIDHIIPLSKFNLIDKTQFLKACHYTNLQPLWAKDNLSKGNRI